MNLMNSSDLNDLNDERNTQQQQQEEAPSTFQKIEELESHGISKQDIQKLKTAGYHTIESVSYSLLLSSYSYSYLYPLHF